MPCAWVARAAMAAYAFLLLALLAPALDFLRSDLIPSEYFTAVAEIRSARVCQPGERPVRAQSHRDEPGGSVLVQPLHLRRVPIAAGYEQHFRAAVQLGFIRSRPEDRLSSDTICAAQVAVSALASGELPQLRSDASALVARHGHALRPHSLRLNEQLMPPDVFIIVGGMNVLLLAALVDGLELRDRDVARGFWHGFQAIGMLPDSGAHRQLAVVTPRELYEFEGKYALIMAGNEAWHDDLESMVDRRHNRPARSDAEAGRRDAVVATTRKELSKGLISPPMSRGQVIAKFGYGRYRAMLRSAIPKTVIDGVVMDWRCIDDGLRALLNAATLPVETIVTPSFEFSLHVARVVQRSASVLGLAMPLLAIGLDDLASAYRTCPTAQPQFNLFAVWSPEHEAVRYHYTYGFVFGLTSSVTQFNRFPEVMVAAARCLGAVPVAHFIDDYMICDLRAAGSSGQDLLALLHQHVGDGIAFGGERVRLRSPTLDNDKRRPMGPRNIQLGVDVDVSEAHVGPGVVMFRATEQRVSACLSIWDDAEEEGIMEPSLAGSLRGKQNFLLEAAPGRVGRAPSLVLVQREFHDESYEFTPALRHAAEFYRALLPNLPAWRARVAPSTLWPITIYSDAMFRPRKRLRRSQCAASLKDAFVSRLGFVLYDPHCDPSHSAYAPERVVGCEDGHLQYASSPPPDDVVATFARSEGGQPLKTYIAQCEMVAAIAVYYTLAARVRGREVNHWIDNTVALSALVHGYARKVDLARMVNAFHLQASGLDTHVWFEFVPSLANIADLPSRDEFELLTRLGGRRVPLTVPPAGDWIAPLDTWLSRFAEP